MPTQIVEMLNANSTAPWLGGFAHLAKIEFEELRCRKLVILTAARKK
jgi:hypothetical protein